MLKLRKLVQNICLFGTGVWLSTSALAQSPTPWAITPAGVAIAPAQASTIAFEQYNAFNGYLNASLPLHHIGGRGEAGFDLVWNLQPGWLAAYNGTPGQNAIVAIDPYPSNNIAGASSSAFGLGGPGFVYVRTGFTWQSCGSGSYGVATSLTTVVLVMPNGGQRSLIDTATTGSAENVPFNSCTGSQPATWDAGRGTAFKSSDSSQIQFTATSKVLEQANNGHGYGVSTVSGTLVFPNGVTYTVANSNITSIEDRNGNRISLSYGGPSTAIDWYLNVAALTQITDSLNRVTNINYNDSSCGGCLTITYPGAGGASRQVKVITGSLASNFRYDANAKSIGALFPTSGQPTSYNYNPTVASAIKFPDGSEYTFQYNSYGEVARAVLPTGGAVEYDYVDGAGGPNDGYETGSGGVMVYRRLSQRREYVNGGSGSIYSSLTTHAVTYPSGQTVDTAQVLDPSGKVLTQTVHKMQGSPMDVLSMNATSCNAWNEGLEAETDFGYPTAIVTVSNSYVNANQTGCTFSPQKLTRTTSMNDGSNEASQIVYSYDTNGYGNIIDEQDYDWTTASSHQGTLLRDTQTKYFYSSNPSYAAANINLIRLPWTQSVYDGSNDQLTQTTWNYDQSSPQDTPGIIGHDSNYGTSRTLRGNVTTMSIGNVTTAMSYDIAGNVLTVQNNGNTTTFTYNDDDSNEYAFPTLIKNAVNQVPTSPTRYDYSIGKVTDAYDFNAGHTHLDYNDALDRLTKVTLANGAQTLYAYPSTTERDTYQDQKTTGDQALRTRQLYDGLGRLVETDTFESSPQYIGTTQTYDAAGRLSTTTNPSRPGDGLGFTTADRYDTLGRISAVQAQDQSSMTTTSYSGNQTTVTDAQQHARQTTTDALGRITSVVEDPSSLKYSTTYAYGYSSGPTLNVTQGAQTRTFVYDTLGRLASATNPESGIVSYTYDSAGNLKTRKDARGITTTYSYDALNQLTSIVYSDATPTVTYSFDYGASGANTGNTRGRLLSVSNGNAVDTYSAYDAVGNVLASSQQTLGETYSFGYSYNLAGALTSETYPSGRVVTTGYDGANRASGVTGTVSGQLTNYASGVTYAPHGAPSYIYYGNGLARSFTFTKLLQPYCYWDAIGNNPNSYLFNSCPTWNGNGTLQSVSTQAGGPAQSGSLPSFNDTLVYDSVNRLTQITDKDVNSNTLYAEAFGYDQYGNMWVQGSTGITLAGNTPTANVYSVSNNQISTSTYDAAGNLTNVNGNAAYYDAENRLVQVAETPSYGGATKTFVYDGMGQRVAQQVSGGTTVYVYDAFEKLAAEYSTAQNTSPCNTCYISTDYLGSVRMVTDANSNVVARHDYTPFGQEIPGGTAGRNSQWGSTTDIEPKFTGQLRDQQTGQDFFNARYFAAALGRFNSPDPGNAGADMANPQSWNGYAYVLGNPLALVDPSGMLSGSPCENNFACMGQIPGCLANPTLCAQQNFAPDPVQGWDPFSILQAAFTPTAIGVIAEPYNYGDNPNFGNVYLIPLYGNWDMLSLLGKAIWSPWYNVQATMEGPLSGKTAPPFNKNPKTDRFVALPIRGQFSNGDCVRVRNPKTGKSDVVPVGDVGPWNGGGTTSNPVAFDDPYWMSGGAGYLGGAGFQAPETSTGTDLRGRTVGRWDVGSGIDISYALQQDLGFPGNSRVAWRFEACPNE